MNNPRQAFESETNNTTRWHSTLPSCAVVRQKQKQMASTLFSSVLNYRATGLTMINCCTLNIMSNKP